MAEEDVATLHKLLIDAARTDNMDQLDEVFSRAEKFEEKFNINYQDGIRNTALHYAAMEGSPEVLEALLVYDGCDVDYVNIEGATPLHLAVKIPHPPLRALIVDSLLDAGADTSIKDNAGELAEGYVAENDTETLKAFRRREAQDSIADDDIASDDDDEDDFSESDDE